MAYSGLAFGEPRFGQPKTEEERRQTHLALYGGKTLPPRGTGLSKLGGNGYGIVFLVGLFFGAILGYTWAKPKAAVRKVREFREAIGR